MYYTQLFILFYYIVQIITKDIFILWTYELYYYYYFFLSNLKLISFHLNLFSI